MMDKRTVGNQIVVARQLQLGTSIFKKHITFCFLLECAPQLLNHFTDALFPASSCLGPDKPIKFPFPISLVNANRAPVLLTRREGHNASIKQRRKGEHDSNIGYHAIAKAQSPKRKLLMTTIAFKRIADYNVIRIEGGKPCQLLCRRETAFSACTRRRSTAEMIICRKRKVRARARIVGYDYL